MTATETEHERHRRFVAEMKPETVAFLVAHPLPAWLLQERRRAARDAAILAATVFHPGTPDRPLAQAVERDLSRYLTTGWTRGGEPTPGTYRAALHLVALLNNGEPVGREHVRKVLRRARTGLG